MRNYLTILLLGLALGISSLQAQTAPTTKAKDEILKVLELNEDLHQAFFKNGPRQIELKAQELTKAVKGISDPAIEKLLSHSRKQLEEIKAERDREENNQSYHQFSMALMYVLETYNIGNDYQAYYCPMVKKKWIQNSKKVTEVQNPYMPDMPSCGTKESK